MCSIFEIFYHCCFKNSDNLQTTNKILVNVNESTPVGLINNSNKNNETVSIELSDVELTPKNKNENSAAKNLTDVTDHIAIINLF